MKEHYLLPLSITQSDKHIELHRFRQYCPNVTPWINYHHLFYFKTIAEEGSVSKAAERLRIGQPTLSAQLKQFEMNLGFELFERKKKRLQLTEHGRVALDYAKSIFKLGSEMYEALNDRLKPAKPTLHLGALDSVPKHIVLQTVSKAFQISPCQVVLSEGKFDELLRELVSHRTDILLTNYLPAGIGAKGLFSRLVSKKNIHFYGGPRFKPLKSKFPDSLSQQPIIAPTYDSKLRQDLDHWATLHRIELNIVAESQDISMNELMAIHEMGIMPAAPHTFTTRFVKGTLYDIGRMKGVYEEIFLITAQRKIENPIAAALMKSFTL